MMRDTIREMQPLLMGDRKKTHRSATKDAYHDVSAIVCDDRHGNYHWKATPSHSAKQKRLRVK
jgi:hypothetical protein